jgi:triacylglycerol lipase
MCLADHAACAEASAARMSAARFASIRGTSIEMLSRNERTRTNACPVERRVLQGYLAAERVRVLGVDLETLLVEEGRRREGPRRWRASGALTAGMVEPPMPRTLERLVGVLNGAVGDYLARTGNGLATELTLAHGEATLSIDRASIARAYPGATSRVVVLVHGLMCTEDVFRFPDGSDYGSLLARDLGYTPLYVRYNSGLAIGANGEALSLLLEALVERYPVSIEELLLVGHSMGGLVIRSACHAAHESKSTWLGLARRAIYVGTPHRGAPLERVGRTVSRLLEAIPDPYTRLIAEIAELRSEGIKDLGDADLRLEDGERRRTGPSLTDPEHPVPLLPSLGHYLLAGTLVDDPTLAALFGDAIVPLASATNAAKGPRARDVLPPEHVKVFPGIHHLGLAANPKVYEQIRAFAEGVS